MAEFKVFAGAVHIGHSLLESGDPPMGVAIGKFVPSPAYSSVQSQCRAARELPQAHLNLTIACPNGDRLPADNGISILDFSEELGEIEVHAYGIGYPLYGELFPQHVAAYEAQFK